MTNLKDRIKAFMSGLSGRIGISVISEQLDVKKIDLLPELITLKNENFLIMHKEYDCINGHIIKNPSEGCRICPFTFVGAVRVYFSRKGILPNMFKNIITIMAQDPKISESMVDEAIAALEKELGIVFTEERLAWFGIDGCMEFETESAPCVPQLITVAMDYPLLGFNMFYENAGKTMMGHLNMSETKIVKDICFYSETCEPPSFFIITPPPNSMVTSYLVLIEQANGHFKLVGEVEDSEDCEEFIFDQPDGTKLLVHYPAAHFKDIGLGVWKTGYIGSYKTPDAEVPETIKPEEELSSLIKQVNTILDDMLEGFSRISKMDAPEWDDMHNLIQESEVSIAVVSNSVKLIETYTSKLKKIN